MIDAAPVHPATTRDDSTRLRARRTALLARGSTSHTRRPKLHCAEALSEGRGIRSSSRHALENPRPNWRQPCRGAPMAYGVPVPWPLIAVSETGAYLAWAKDALSEEEQRAIVTVLAEDPTR